MGSKILELTELHHNICTTEDTAIGMPPWTE